MLDAGLRVAEACALRWADVSMTEGTIHVRRGKGGKPRVVPCTWDTMRALGVDAHDGDRVLWAMPNVHKPTCPRTIQEALARMGRELGIILHPHRLRHTYACELLRAGVGIYDVAMLMGHANIATTAIYLHVQPDDLAARLRAAVAPNTYQLRLRLAA